MINKWRNVWVDGLLLAVLVAFLAGCNPEGNTGNGSTDTGQTLLQSLNIDDLPDTIEIGETLTFSVEGSFDDGTVKDLRDQVTFTISDPSRLSINVSDAIELSAGTSATPGKVTVEVTYTGDQDPVSQQFEITVVDVLEALQISAAETTIPQYTDTLITASALYKNGATPETDVTTSATWTSTDESIIAVSDTSESGVLLEAVGLGRTAIQATFGGKSAAIELEVTEPILESLSISGSAATVHLGETLSFTATGTYQVRILAIPITCSGFIRSPKQPNAPVVIVSL